MKFQAPVADANYVPVLTTQGNPPVATTLPIAAAQVATTVVMTHFVVARGGPPVATGGRKIFPTGGHHKIVFFLEKPQE